eukprot:TRINITY_DN65166_c0_g1_i1.p1 TRINITY_DN65166_c0_g1~~TRINITY_DN65166_c0_g1_i1.p1  ORF type:complete len:262 (-),score=26.34 TRINITY_DN65166_c0_g1_i1:5-790(-)
MLRYCTSKRVFDIGAKELCSFTNSTHCFLSPLVSAEDLCNKRWPDPPDCTANVMDIVGTFIFEKLLAACLLTPTLLLLSSFALSELPRWMVVGIVRTEDADGVRVALSLRSIISGDMRQVISLSDTFSPSRALQRLAVWTDLALAWGLLYPPIAFVGLANFLIECWCYEKATSNLRFYQQSSQGLFQMPRLTMLFWFMAGSTFGALHAASVVEEEPGVLSVVTALAVATLSWILGFWRSSGLFTAAAESGSDETAIELPQC